MRDELVCRSRVPGHEGTQGSNPLPAGEPACDVLQHPAGANPESERKSSARLDYEQGRIVHQVLCG
ncbi:MAG TPA: hypothetical protein VF289_07735 [Brachybacterium sp.]